MIRIIDNENIERKIYLSYYDYRRLYFNEKYDLTIIEILPDKINEYKYDYLEIDENIYKENSENLFEFKPVCII